MPKRTGYLYEKFLTVENFVHTEYLIGINKPDNKMARHIMHNADYYGKRLFDKYSKGNYKFHESRLTVIVDSYKGKTRNLKIPCLEDQAVQMAWLNIATPYILKRNYYYNCGSIPEAGQTRCVEALKKWLKNPRYKYGATTDIRKFYDTCPHSAVIAGLRRIFKDEKFIQVAIDILNSMSDNGIGLAIGHPTSHWFANMALMRTDNEFKRIFPKIKMTRYMDDMAFASTNKRELRKAIDWIKTQIGLLGLKLKKWSRFLIAKRGLAFLSFRFFNGYTILIKRLMCRISRRFRKAKLKMNVHIAQGLISYIGILKQCNSYNFRCKWVYPYTNIKHLKRTVSSYDKKHILNRAACA